MLISTMNGVSGAFRGDELLHIKVQDKTEHEDLLVVCIPHTQKKEHRQFTFGEEFTEVVSEYKALRPPVMTTDRFLINYQKGKRTVQVI